MRKISLSLIATLIALPALANSNTSAPMGKPMSATLAGVKPAVCEMPKKDMKKVMKPAAAKHHMHPHKEEQKPAMIAAAPVHHMSSMFDGWRLTGGATYAWNSSTSTVQLTSLDTGVVSSGTSSTATLPNAFSKFYADLGYSKVIENHILLGGSVFGGYDNYGANASSTWTPTLSATDLSFGIDWFVGGKVNVGVLLGEKVAFKLIGELNYSRYNLQYTSSTQQNRLGWNAAGALGAGLDFAVTDRVIVGIGGKWIFSPTVTLNQTSTGNGSITTATNNVTGKYSGNNFEVFGEIGFRLSQN